MGKEMGLALPCERTIRNQLTDVVIPAVDIVYQDHMKTVEATVRGVGGKRGVDLAVDGRYDSPGYTATHCTISIIDLSTSLILRVINMHKLMPGIEGISGRMEKEGVKRGLKEVIANQFEIRSVVSDNDARISKMLREESQFQKVQHLLDFWHIIKGVNHDLRELAKKKKCANIQYWRRRIINHGYYVHYRYGRNRQRAINYWKSILAHVTGRHGHFEKVPFLTGIRKCKHKYLPESVAHQIDRKSEEFRQLKAVIMKPSLLAALERAAPKKNTSPCESFNSLVNLYAPKRIASSHAIYNEKIKLAVMHYNSIAYADLTHTREEKSSYVVKAKGREATGVKRRMTAVDHVWRQQSWSVIHDVIREKRMAEWMKRNHVPDGNAFTAALVMEARDQEEDEMTQRKRMDKRDDEGEESDASIELGGGEYGEGVDSDDEPVYRPIMLSDEDDHASSTDEETEVEVLSSGSEWDEGEVLVIPTGRGRGRGRGRPRGSRGARGGVATSSALVAEEEGEEGKEEQKVRPKKGVRGKKRRGG
ncbi:hypothetical protein PFISCL1PPCAC_11427, partial [Pristionchus fissidentatus]